jgi:hypothetical protein
VLAIIKKIGKRIEPLLCNVHPKGGEQIGKGLFWNVMRLHSLSQCDKDGVHCLPFVTLIQIMLPTIKLLKPFL